MIFVTSRQLKMIRTLCRLRFSRYANKNFSHVPNSNGDDRDFEVHKQAKMVTIYGAAVNTTLALGKGILGYSTNSTGLIADAVHSMCDLVTDSVVYFSLTKARSEATPEKPWGHGKIEPLGSLTVASLLVSTGLGIGYSALQAGIDISTKGALADSLLVCDNNVTLSAALIVSIISVISKEILFHISLKSGQEAFSDVVITNAWQHRADGLVSASVFFGLVAAINGYPLFDPFAGMLISGVIVKQGFQSLLEALRDLTDVPTGDEETLALKNTCLTVPGVLSVPSLYGRKSGPFLYVECHVGVSGTISASAAHRLAEIVRSQLLFCHKNRVANAIVHVDPLGSCGLGESLPETIRDHLEIEKIVTAAVLPVQGIQGVSDVQVYYHDDGHIGVKVDVIMDCNMTIRQGNKVSKEAEVEILTKLPGVRVDIDLELFPDDDGDESASTSKSSFRLSTAHFSPRNVPNSKT